MTWRPESTSCLKGVAVVPLIHIHCSRHGPVPEPECGELPRRQISTHHEPVLRGVGEPAILAAEVVLVGEKNGRNTYGASAPSRLPATCNP